MAGPSPNATPTPLRVDETAYVLSTRDALKLWLIVQEETGKLTPQRAQQLWQQWKQYPNAATNYFSTAQDLAMLRTISKEFGSPSARMYIKEYRGKPYLILKGSPLARKVLTGTRYGLENPKVVVMRLTRAGVSESVREGGMLTLVLVSAFDIFDYVMNDQETLADLVGQLASDFVKVAIATGATLALSGAIAGTVVSTVALGPLLAAVLIGVGIGFALNAIDNHWGLTKKLKAALNALEQKLQNKVTETRQGLIDRMEDAASAAVFAMVDAVVSSVEAYVWRKINDVTWYALPR